VSLTPSQRIIRARIAAHTSWANCPDPTQRTAPARSGFLARFSKQVDPEGTLPPEERQRRAQSALRAHMTMLAYRSSKARTG
jgi:hypothetical protein